jgi:hypothetical protein
MSVLATDAVTRSYESCLAGDIVEQGRSDTMLPLDRLKIALDNYERLLRRKKVPLEEAIK